MASEVESSGVAVALRPSWNEARVQLGGAVVLEDLVGNRSVGTPTASDTADTPAGVT